ncbi:hypothetical protein Acr_17g0011670 [Actinidia rufa]|uniref:hAT-like transposase RNase-H fold domain-containing protein n=1 Tax=Actinidia rufa TaxID=165716 RepID=A0A7J0G471_9ERIC|nr:hypothetical protein Acr_17g0011670 [Actinidia rufa]
MLCTCFNSVGFNWLASPAATELEMVVMDWLAHMLKLPKSFMFQGTGGGVIQGTTSDSILCTLVAARDRALENVGVDNIGKLVVYGSDQTHSTYTKACKLAGIYPRNIRSVPAGSDTCFAMSPVALRKVIDADVAAGLVPLYLCVTVGTTSTTAVDPLEDLADVANDYGVWVHVDAAYGGSACICPEFRHYLDGIELVDSLSLSPHKWLLSYLDCCCLWVKKPGLLVKALSTNPEYLRNKPSESDSVVDYKDWQVGWPKMFEGFMKSDPRFELVVPRIFSLVCFRLNPHPGSYPDFLELLNKKLLEWVNSTGGLYMTHTVAGGLYMLRFAVGATLTEESHVVAAWKLIKEGADVLLRTWVSEMWPHYSLPLERALSSSIKFGSENKDPFSCRLCVSWLVSRLNGGGEISAVGMFFEMGRGSRRSTVGVIVVVLLLCVGDKVLLNVDFGRVGWNGSGGYYAPSIKWVTPIASVRVRERESLRWVIKVSWTRIGVNKAAMKFAHDRGHWNLVSHRCHCKGNAVKVEGGKLYTLVGINPLEFEVLLGSWVLVVGGGGERIGGKRVNVRLFVGWSAVAKLIKLDLWASLIYFWRRDLERWKSDPWGGSIMEGGLGGRAQSKERDDDKAAELYKSLYVEAFQSSNSDELAVDVMASPSDMFDFLLNVHEHVRALEGTSNPVVTSILGCDDANFVSIEDDMVEEAPNPTQKQKRKLPPKEHKPKREKYISPCWDHFNKLDKDGVRWAECEECEDGDDGTPIQRQRGSGSHRVPILPTKLDWKNCRMFVKFLKLFYDATKKFSASFFVTSNTFFDEIISIEMAIAKLIKNYDPLLSQMALNMQKKFDKYWGWNGGKKNDNINFLVYVAVVLDPRFKLRWVKFCLDKSKGVEVGEAMEKLVKSKLNELYDAYAKRERS